MMLAGFKRQLRLLRHRASIRRGNRSWTARIITAIIIMVILITVLVIRIKPLVIQMAEYSVGDVVTQYINEIVAEKAADGSFEYDKLVTLETDGEGNITALITNMSNINLLSAEITESVIEEVSDMITTDIGIPIGNIIGDTFFAGRGPKINVRLVSVTNISATFSNEFTTAGINQTRHQVILNVVVDTKALIPGEAITNTVKSSIVIAETVIVGAVPEYAYLK